ncbi:hypothetical protein P154DRAFT_623773 [Amniculicola lignicola CBS 123094]|uniref:RING-type domain-containing protein n=1 Tax=Amniculicola lignicola CBS 123094 TaxID=1392246 RepID=A0A6A5WDG4_9PLEO|nr:hypothetical protein P154DRAFT_623773 [Amniculicola lignicola CBS 123094]
MPETPMTAEQAATWAKRLNTDYYIPFNDDDPDCPFGQIIAAVKEFTSELATHLQSDRNSIITQKEITLLYHSLPNFKDFGKLHRWVRNVANKHPQRRSQPEHYFLLMSKVQTGNGPLSMSLSEKVKKTMELGNAWYKETHKLENLLLDPDPLHIFSTGLHPIAAADAVKPAPEDTCGVCMESFEAPEKWAKNEVNRPQLTKCNHIFCRQCLNHWRREISSGNFTCPLCRACLVCGRDECKYHCINIDRHAPRPLVAFVRDVYPDFQEKDLVKVFTEKGWVELRERTRETRVTYARIDEFFGKDVETSTITDGVPAMTILLHLPETR